LLSQGCKTTSPTSGVKANDGFGDTVSAPAQIVFNIVQARSINALQMTRGLGGGEPIGVPIACGASGDTAYVCKGRDAVIQWAATAVPTISTATLWSSDGHTLVKSYMCRGSWPSSASLNPTISCDVVGYNVRIVSKYADGREAFTAAVYSLADSGDESTEATFDLSVTSDGFSLSGRNNDFAVFWKPTPIPGASIATLNVNPQAPMQLKCTKLQSSLHSPGGANYTYYCR
jgi:hypothetical protein